MDEIVIIGTVFAFACIIAGFIGLTNNPISRYLMKDDEMVKK